MLLNPKTPLVFGIIATAGLASYLFIHHPLPDSLSRVHAQVMPDTDIDSCTQCHTGEGLTAGCLTCHTEIANQLDTTQGYHAYLAEDEPLRCGRCHSEHHGQAFPLVSTLSWPGGDPNAFDHPHCDYQLTGHHDQLQCVDCHDNKQTQVFTLPDYPQHPRLETFLGLSQECLACHVDVHAWPSEKACLDCHNQIAFDPAPAFHHHDVFVLEGIHAKTDCAGCHPRPDTDKVEVTGADRTPGSLPFHKVTGETCEECHPNPHYTTWEAGCQSCHLGRDIEWHEGMQRMDPPAHEPTGFALTGAHMATSCTECHPQDHDYPLRYLDAQADGYQRQQNHCQGCHEDVHLGTLSPTCTTCHQTSGWKDGDLLFDHDRDTAFALDAVHKDLSCQECHAPGDLTYRVEGIECASCHEIQAEAMRGQARQIQIDPDPHFERVACVDCHAMDVSGQSMASHAQRCADCHNDQYTQLAYQWAHILQQQQSAVEHLAGSLSGTDQQTINRDLSEARESGFHHVHLTLRLYDRLLTIWQVDEDEMSESKQEAP